MPHIPVYRMQVPQLVLVPQRLAIRLELLLRGRWAVEHQRRRAVADTEIHRHADGSHVEAEVAVAVPLRSHVLDVLVLGRCILVLPNRRYMQLERPDHMTQRLRQVQHRRHQLPSVIRQDQRATYREVRC